MLTSRALQGVGFLRKFEPDRLQQQTTLLPGCHLRCTCLLRACRTSLRYLKQNFQYELLQVIREQAPLDTVLDGDVGVQ